MRHKRNPLVRLPRAGGGFHRHPATHLLTDEARVRRDLAALVSAALASMATTLVIHVLAAGNSVTTTGRLSASTHGHHSFRFFERQTAGILNDYNFRIFGDSSHALFAAPAAS